MTDLSELGLASPLVGSIRFLALFLVAPFFGHSAVPARLRMGFALVVASAMGAAAPAQLNGPLGLTELILSEALLGFALGFAARLVMAGFGLMGELVSVQGGLGAATVLDPSSNASTVALASLVNVFAVLLFMVIGGDHALLRVMATSLEAIPVGSVSLAPETFSRIVSLGAVIFEMAVRLAMPVTVAMLLANLAVGILGRMIPQLNLMTVQLPALLALTLFLIMMGSVSFIEVMSASLVSWIDHSTSIVLGGG